MKIRPGKAFLRALAARTAATELPRDIPNRADLRLAGINVTQRTGRPNARLKKARAKHKKQAGEKE